MISLDINMLCTTAVIRIVNALYCLAVNANVLTWVRNSTCKTIAASFMETFTAGIFTITRMLTPHHNIALTAAMVFVIGTITYSTG